MLKEYSTASANVDKHDQERSTARLMAVIMLPRIKKRSSRYLVKRDAWPPIVGAYGATFRKLARQWHLAIGIGLRPMRHRLLRSAAVPVDGQAAPAPAAAGSVIPAK